MVSSLSPKVGRCYYLLINPPGTNPSPFILKPGNDITMEFTVVRNTYGSSNESQIRLYNLAKETQGQLLKDAWNNTDNNPMILGVGYGGFAPIIFNGNMKYCWTVREGVDWITEIHGFDLGNPQAKDFDGATFPKGTPLQIVIKTLMGAFLQDNQAAPTGLTIGAIGNFPGTLQRSETYSGNLFEILNQLTNGGFSIDNGKIYALNLGESVAGADVPYILSAGTGLLGTPVRQADKLVFDTILEPNLRLYQQVHLISQTAQNYTGFYRVIGLRHRGIVSPVTSGDAITTVELQYSVAPFTTVPQT
jgi:hypothetical protein